jgi:hypothetical protein
VADHGNPRNIAIDDTRVGNHCIHSVEEQGAPGSPANKLDIVIAAQLVRDVNTTHVMIVVSDTHESSILAEERGLASMFLPRNRLAKLERASTVLDYPRPTRPTRPTREAL